VLVAVGEHMRVENDDVVLLVAIGPQQPPQRIHSSKESRRVRFSSWHQSRTLMPPFSSTRSRSGTGRSGLWSRKSAGLQPFALEPDQLRPWLALERLRTPPLTP
jgi:hypothetical protein